VCVHCFVCETFLRIGILEEEEEEEEVDLKMPAASAHPIGPDGTPMRPRKGRPPKGGYPFPYPTSTDPARTIYIGKNNARHWADLKTRLGYNGDVDFVTFLLRLAEERLR
jgi:hypothetical protein